MTFPELKVLFTNFICCNFSQFFISNEWQGFTCFLCLSALLLILSSTFIFLGMSSPTSQPYLSIALFLNPSNWKGGESWKKQILRIWNLDQEISVLVCFNSSVENIWKWYLLLYVSISLHSYLCSLKQYFSIGHYRLWGRTVGIAPSTQSSILNPWGRSSSNTSRSYSVFKSHLVTEHKFMCPTRGEAK